MNYPSLTPLVRNTNTKNHLSAPRQPMQQQVNAEWNRLIAQKENSDTTENETHSSGIIELLQSILKTISGNSNLLLEMDNKLDQEQAGTTPIDPDSLPSAFKDTILNRNDYPEERFQAILDLAEARKLGEAWQAVKALPNDPNASNTKAEAIETAIDATVEAMYQSIWFKYSENAEKDLAIALSNLADTQTERHPRNINFKPSDSADWVMNRKIVPGDKTAYVSFEDIDTLRREQKLGEAWVEAKRLFNHDNENTRKKALAITQEINTEINGLYNKIWAERVRGNEENAKTLNDQAYKITKGHPRNSNFNNNNSDSVMNREVK